MFFCGLKLISGYIKANNIDVAKSLFDQMREKSLISLTIMVSGYVQCGRYHESLELLREMMSKIWPDEVVLVTALLACAHVEYGELGRCIQNLIGKYAMIVDGFLANGLIDMYGKCG